MGDVRSIATIKLKLEDWKELHVPRLCAKSYWRYIPYVKSTHKKYCTKLWHLTEKENIRRVHIKKSKYQGRHLYATI